MAAAASASSSPSLRGDGFARALPPPHPRETLLFDYFRRCALERPGCFAQLAVRRSEIKGRYLATAAQPNRGALMFEERPVLSVSDDESVCLACGIRHIDSAAGAATASSSAAAAAASSASKCARFSSLFGAMKTALASAAPLAAQADYPLARVRELLKFVGVTHAAIFAPERTAAGQPKRSEQQRKADCPAWLLLGLDDGSYTTESMDPATGQTIYSTTPRPSDPDRTMVAQQVHAILPLTFRKHYPPALLEQVLNVLELNAHETSEAGATAAASSSGSDASSSSAPLSVEGMSGDAVFPFFAMCEHSCMENCCWSASDNVMHITALRDFVRGGTPKQAADRYAAEAAAAAAAGGKIASAPAPASVPTHPSSRPRGSMRFDFHSALVRGLSSAFEQSLKMHPPAVPIDVELANRQHQAYCEVLRKCVTGGVIEVPQSAEFPDCNFIEDTAIVLGDVVVISRPGALERRGETAAVAEAIAAHKMPFRRVLQISEPATMDGGDILFTGRHLFVGESKRTNAAATAQLQSMFAHDAGVDFTVHALPVTAGLHLKSIVSILADGVLVLASNPAAEIVRQQILSIDASYSFVVVPDVESSNVLRIGQTLLVQKGFDASTALLRPHAAQHGLQIVELEMSELIKADGALTCGSLLVTDLSAACAEADAELIPLSINYAPVFLPTSKRRAYLQMNYGFRCVCPLCEGQSSGVHDLARAFRCTQPATSSSAPAAASSAASSKAAASSASLSALCAGTMCPLGESTSESPGRWSCTLCGCAASIDSIRAFLATETYIVSDLLRIKESTLTLPSTAPLAEHEDAFDEMAADPQLVASRMMPKLEQIVAAVTGGASGGAAAATGSAAAPSSASSSSAASLASSFSSLRCTPSASKTSRKLARLRKIDSKLRSASGAGTPAGFCLLDGEQRAIVGRMHQTHWMVNAAAELILSAKLSQLLSLPEPEAAPQWAALLPLAHLRLASLRTVLRSASHWSLAREFDRLGALCTLAGLRAEAAAAWAAAEQVHQACFGSEADSTRRARARRERPPQNRQELGLDEPEEDEEE